jgi:TRAP-type transport system periplasmic protein
VRTPEDLEGLKLRTMENQVHMAAFSGMGASPTPMAFPEVFGALQQGVVDGQENPVTVIAASKFWEVQKYVSLTGHVYSPAIFLASPALFDGLTDEQKGWFYEAAKAGVAANRAEVNRLEEVGVELLRENGMEVITDIDKAPFAALAEATVLFGLHRPARHRDDRAHQGGRVIRADLKPARRARCAPGPS